MVFCDKADFTMNRACCWSSRMLLYHILLDVSSCMLLINITPPYCPFYPYCFILESTQIDTLGNFIIFMLKPKQEAEHTTHHLMFHDLCLLSLGIILMQTFIYLFVIPIQPLVESEFIATSPEILIQIPFQSSVRENLSLCFGCKQQQHLNLFMSVYSCN